MIRVRRGATPAVLLRNGTKWVAALSAATTPKEISTALSKYRHPQIREALEALFHGKCAYCESHIAHITWGHVEHFRPKAVRRYRRYAFTWSNLLLSCPMCNGATFKGAKFPLASEGGPLVDPCRDDPAKHFEFDYDIATRMASVIPLTQRAKVTEQVLGLNRPPLVRYRSNLLRKLLLIKASANVDPASAAEVLASLADDAEYLGFARKYLT